MAQVENLLSAQVKIMNLDEHMQLDKNPYANLKYTVDFPTVSDPVAVSFDLSHLKALKEQSN